MKKLFFVLSFAAVISCKKTSTSVVLNCKLAKIIHITGGTADTSVYTYTGDNLSYTTTYSSYSTVYSYNYIKSGSQYLITRYTNSTQSLDGFFTLDANGLYDTSRINILPGMTLNNTTKLYHNSNNYLTRAIYNYGTYENDIKYYYNSLGNYTYWIYDVYDYRPSPAPSKDSVVFEYYTDLLKKAERSPFESKYGKLENNLVKKRLFYNLLSSGTLRRTDDYEYQTDANGLITREIWTVTNQPGNVVARIDTTYIQYNCN